MQLTFEQLKSVAQGAVRLTESDGAVRFHRFTREQEELYRRTDEGFYRKTFCTAGVRLEFRTDSGWIGLDAEVSKATPSRTYFSFDVFSDGKPAGHMDNFPGGAPSGAYVFETYPLGRFQKRFDLGPGEKTVSVVFPWGVGVGLHGVTLDDSSSVVPVRRDKTLLTFGDSITQGYDVPRPSDRFAAKLAEHLGAEEFCKAIGGEVFFPPLAETKEPFTPDQILVAYGTNDWKHTDRPVCRRNSRLFLEALRGNYPSAGIFVLTPLIRLDHGETSAYGSFGLVERDVVEAAEGLGNVRVIRCRRFVPEDPGYFADRRIHPNERGSAAFTAALIDAVGTV